MRSHKLARLYRKAVYRVRLTLGGIFRNKKVEKMRGMLKNHTFSIISSNCCGAILTHDLGIQFNTPTVNLFFEAEDFVKFCEQLEYYLQLQPVYLYHHQGYPVCGIGDIKVYAMHYETAEDFIDTWNRRRQRINFDNLFIMMTDRDGFHDGLLDRIDRLPYKKVLFSHKKYDQYPFVCHVKQFEHDNCVGDMFMYADFFGNRYYEKAFDCVKWLNNA